MLLHMHKAALIQMAADGLPVPTAIAPEPTTRWSRHSLPRYAIVAIAALALAAMLFFDGTLARVIAVAAMSGVLALAVVGLRASATAEHLAMVMRKEMQDLVRERDAALSANLTKSRYLASVSHEIRSPLNSIYGYAQLIEREEGISPRDAAQVIRRSAEHLNSLIEGLLDISQVERGVLRVKPDVVRLDAFMQQIVSMFRPAAQAKGLSFEYLVASPLPRFVKIDQNRLRQVLINLLSNAIKYTEKGSVTLRIAYQGQIAKIDVSDTGKGIAPEDQERIFAPYERATSAGGEAGVGLGLSISRALVDILGGHMEMQSEPGVGSTFRVTVMLPDVAGKLENQATPGHVTGYLGPRQSVIVADDDPEQLALIQRLLSSLGFDVTAVPHGEAALACCAERTPDLAILDITMPGLSGWETAVKLRERADKDLSILMLSANSEEFHKPDHPQAVHDLFLVKPVDFADLVMAIGGLLKLSWTWGEDETANIGAPLPELNEAAREHVMRLRECLRIGYMRGIEDEVKQLAEADPRAKDLVAQLTDALDRFDLAGMAAALEVA